MIFLSLLLVLLSASLFIAGLYDDSQALVWGSVLASVIAGVFLVISVIQARAEPLAEGQEEVEDEIDTSDQPYRSTRGSERLAYESSHTTVLSSARQTSTESSESEAVSSSGNVWTAPEASKSRKRTQRTEWIPPVHGRAQSPHADTESDDSALNDDSVFDQYDDPPDEPGEEYVSSADAQLLADSDEDVFVVDGRPRYHLAECQHLVGREAVPLYLNEARDAGFTPCALCSPDSTLATRFRDM